MKEETLFTTDHNITKYNTGKQRGISENIKHVLPFNPAISPSYLHKRNESKETCKQWY